MKSISVFCGSQWGNNPLYSEDAKAIGKILAQKNITLIYGGGNKGLMGDVANAVLENGGKVVGIIPEILLEWEQHHQGITELKVVTDMHSRKKLLFSMADAAIILPGGNGTLDELFEMLTWNTLKIHDKKIFIVNTNGFYKHLLAHINEMFEQGFLYENPNERIKVLNVVDDLKEYIF